MVYLVIKTKCCFGQTGLLLYICEITQFHNATFHTQIRKLASGEKFACVRGNTDIKYQDTYPAFTNQVDTNVAPASHSLSQDLLYVNFGSMSYVDGHRDSICNVRCQHDDMSTSMIVLLKREDVLSRTCLTVFY